jgi:beta-lactamase regulating signal transducer with metallopeptidase domain
METISPSLLTFLVNSFWQIPLVAAVAALACRWMRNGPASHRHVVWAAALLAGVILPSVSIRSGEHSASWLAAESQPESGTAAAPFEPTPSAARPVPLHAQASSIRTVPFGRTTGAVLAGAYFLFLLFRLGKLAWTAMRTVQIQQAAEARPAPPLLEQVWARCLRTFGLRRVRLLSSARVSSPLMAGAWRKTIILPESLFDESSEDVLTAAIGHEMAHIARRDYAFNILYELLYLPVSFHPAAWVIRRGIGQTREMACDERVTRHLLDPAVYARSIMSIAAGMTGGPRPGYTLGVFDDDILEERIRRLVEPPAGRLKRARLALASGLAALAVCAVIASGLALTARAQSGSSGEMKLAAEAYNRGDFKAAVEHFENAVRLDPANIDAKLFLANALMREFFVEKAPADGPLLAGARRQYLDVLASDARNKLAMQGMVAIALQMKKLSEGREWALKLIDLDPKDKTAYYAAGVLEWAAIYPEYQRSKQAAGVKQQEYWIPDANVRKRLRDQYLPQLEEGFRMLQIALQLDPDYADAMAYMNLLDRLKSGMVDSSSESADLISKGDDWVGKALAAKRRHPDQPAGPTQLDVDGPPPGPASAQKFMAPPPPPPPATAQPGRTPPPPRPPAAPDN